MCTARMGVANTLGARGTTNYMAPENFDNEDEQCGRSASDVYSTAMVLYEMSTGDMPWRDRNMGQVRACSSCVLFCSQNMAVLSRLSCLSLIVTVPPQICAAVCVKRQRPAFQPHGPQHCRCVP